MEGIEEGFNKSSAQQKQDIFFLPVFMEGYFLEEHRPGGKTYSEGIYKSEKEQEK